MSKPAAVSPLAFLQTHFEALEPRKVAIEGFPFELFYHPLNAEQTFKYVQGMNSRVPAEGSRIFAELIVETVKTEEGKPVFALEKGGPNPVEVLTRKADPVIFSALVKHLGKEAPVEEAEDVEKK